MRGRIVVSTVCVLVALSLANVTVLADVLCSVCVKNTINPNCGFLTQDTCSTNGCSNGTCDCILWVNWPVDSCWHANYSDCTTTGNKEICSSGSYKRVCPGMTGCSV